MSQISLETIKNYCGERICDLAKKYMPNASFYCYINSSYISAFCQELTNGYKVRIYIKQNVIKNSFCSCNNIKGPCFHIAAVMLLWHSSPEKFPSKCDLISQISSSNTEILEKMVDLDSPLFELSALT